MNTTQPRRSNGSATYFLGRSADTWQRALNRRRRTVQQPGHRH